MNTSLHSSDYNTRIAINESSRCLPKTNWHPRDAQGENMIASACTVPSLNRRAVQTMSSILSSFGYLRE